LTIEPWPPERHRLPPFLVLPGLSHGTLDNYFHFMFGYLLPFIEIFSPIRRGQRFQFCDCGPMNRILLNLPGFNTQVVAAQHMVMAMSGAFAAMGGRPRITVPGFDSEQAYSLPRFIRVREAMSRHFGPQIQAAAAAFPAASEERFVLMVDRAPPHPYYEGEVVMTNVSGTARRSVPNMAELTGAVGARYPVVLVRLEELDLFQQIHLFARAWRVVAQHGAGLANLIWMRKGATVVEIVPSTPESKVRDYFGPLAKMLGLSRVVVPQDDLHAAVPVGALWNAWSALD
jgi:hypothetical protein